MSKKQIHGTIAYIITQDGDHVSTEYTSSAENDLAAIAISELILRDTANYYEGKKKELKYKAPSQAILRERKLVSNTFNILKKGRSACQRILDMMLLNFDGFIEHKAEEDKKSEEIKDWLKEKVTVEEGVLSHEEAEKLLKDRFKDLALPTQSEPFEKTKMISLEELKKDSSRDENVTNL